MNAHAALLSRDDVEPHRLSLRVEDFILLQESGALDRYAKAELIEGEIYTVNAIDRPHAGILADLVIDFGTAVRALGRGLKVYAPVSARLDDHNLPEPDLVVATIEPEQLIVKASIRLALEVSDSTLRFDLSRKVPLYARAGIPELWIVDVNGRTIARMTAPDSDAYGSLDTFAFGDDVPCATLPGIVIRTAHLA